MRLTYRHFGERVVFDEAGLEVSQWLAGSLRLAWSDIEFVSLAPVLERREAGWGLKESRFDPGGAAAWLERKGLLGLSFVVKDRRPHLAKQRGWWARSHWYGRLQPMRDADDALRVDQSLLSIDLHWKRGLDGSRDALMDLLAAHCRFDIVVDF